MGFEFWGKTQQTLYLNNKESSLSSRTYRPSKILKAGEVIEWWVYKQLPSQTGESNQNCAGI